MRRILVFLTLILSTVAAFGQLIGSGTYASPWSGTLAGDATWTGTVYINGDITVDNEKLTISAGTTVIFLAENSDLIITGTGSLDANGSSGNMITITADDDNDGNYGEAGEAWGHIFFNLPSEANQSVLNYCVIEYGDTHAFTDSRGYGGGIFANYSNLLISNTTIRNNWGEWGGGIFVGSSKSPTIDNCYILNNKSDRGGGGVYCWNNSGSLIQNTIFDSNQCLETSISYYTGGALAGQTGTSIKVLNCTFVNNTTTRAEGNSVLLHTSPNARLINCIFWGASDKQIYMYGTSANNVVNCGYRGITYTVGSPVSPVVLNASNSAVDGPNFVATDGSDWSVTFVSPLRDTGVNTYTGVTIPNSDYEGTGIIGTKDMGAFETRYSRWNGSASTLWPTASNWDASVDPASGTGDVVIPGGLTNFPTGSPGQNFTIPAGKQFIVEPGGRVTLNSLTNNGILKLNYSASGFYSFILNSYTRVGGATEEIQMWLSGGGSDVLEDYKWHFISSPVSSLSTSPFSGVTLDLAQFVESRPAFSLLQGWVAYDGYVYSTGVSNGPTFNTLTPGKGYNFWDGVDNTFTFGGLLNTSNTSVPINFSGIPTLHGYNLIGNPFTSGLNWDDIVNSVYFAYPANTSKGMYLTRNNVECVYNGGVGIPGDVTGIIPPGQAFFVKTYATGNTITFPAAARTHNNIHSQYKGSGVIPLVRIKLTGALQSDETVVRFDEAAKEGIDNDFDVTKMFTRANSLQVYTQSGTDKYAINGIPFPSTYYEIPLVVSVNKNGSYVINTTELQGLDGYYVYLTDRVGGYMLNLKMNPSLSFTADSGTVSNRFIITIADINTSVEDLNKPADEFVIYHSGGEIYMEPKSDKWNGKTGTVTLYDLSGRAFERYDNMEFNTGGATSVQAPSAKGVVLVEIKSGPLRYTGKTIIKE